MLHVAAAASRLSAMKPRVGAAAVRGGRIIAIGYNRAGSSKQARDAWSRHAEVTACLRADLRGATMYVYREHGLTGEPLLARPCKSCWAVMRAAGVRRVVFTTAGGQADYNID